MSEVNFFIAFLSGLLIGITPCILLMLSVFGTTIVLSEEKKNFLPITIGLISGMILAYIIISIIVVNAFLILEEVYSFFKYIFAAILIFIGVWQIIECRKEKSIIFGTPKKVKTLLKDFIEKNSGFYAFLVGILFVLIKIPCFGTVYLALLENIYKNPLLYVFIIVYLIGMVIPVILLLILLRLGIESIKIDEYRLKYRTHLRILNGGVLISLSIYLLIF